MSETPRPAEVTAAAPAGSMEFEYEDLNVTADECKAFEYRPALLVTGINEIMEILKTLPPAQVKAAVSELAVLFSKLKGVIGRAALFAALQRYKIPFDDKAEPTEADREAAVRAIEPVLAKYRRCVVDMETFLEKYVKDVIYDDKGDGKLVVVVEGPWREVVIELPAQPWIKKDGTPALPKRLVGKLEMAGLVLDGSVDPETLRDVLSKRVKTPAEAAKDVIAEGFDKLLKEHPPIQEKNRDRPWCSLTERKLYIQSWYINELDREYAKKLGARYRFIRYAQQLGLIVGEEQYTFGDAKPRIKVVDLDKLAELLEKDPVAICAGQLNAIDLGIDLSKRGEVE